MGKKAGPFGAKASKVGAAATATLQPRRSSAAKPSISQVDAALLGTVDLESMPTVDLMDVLDRIE